MKTFAALDRNLTHSSIRDRAHRLLVDQQYGGDVQLNLLGQRLLRQPALPYQLVRLLILNGRLRADDKAF